MELTNYILLFAGVYSIIIGAINPGLKSRRQLRMEDRIGTGGARLFYLITGLIFIILGIFL